MKYENKWEANGVQIIDTIIIDENSTSISQRVELIKDEKDEVTHEVFFGENIKRVWNTLRAR